MSSMVSLILPLAGNLPGPSPGPVRAEMRLTALAKPPSPPELQAMTVAIGIALGLHASAGPAPTSPWRLCGRWWQPIRS